MDFSFVENGYAVMFNVKKILKLPNSNDDSAGRTYLNVCRWKYIFLARRKKSSGGFDSVE